MFFNCKLFKVATYESVLVSNRAVRRSIIFTSPNSLALDLNNSMSPALTVLEKQRWVDEGNIITAGGISAGIDMSLHLVSKIHSRELAEKTAQKMEFAWTKLS